MTADLKLTEQSMLERFTRALARIVHEERPEALSRPVTVAELYQDIAPYRRMRELAGIEMHADYEHALIRFLAGEGGYARMDPESAAEVLAIEAESVDPDLSAYRQFAACDVVLMFTPQAPRAAAPEAPPDALASEPVPELPLEEPARRPAPTSRAATPAAPPVDARPAPPAAPKSAASSSKGASSKSRASVPAAKPAAPRCAFCGQSLPAGRDVRFCPHCGVDQSARQCADCGETMEEGWRFCVACGAAANA